MLRGCCFPPPSSELRLDIVASSDSSVLELSELYSLSLSGFNFFDGVSVPSVMQTVMIFAVMVAEYNWTSSGGDFFLTTLVHFGDVLVTGGAILT